MSAVLVIDDNRELAENFREILEDEDVSVDVAHDGRAALDMLEAGRYDLVITDIRMPGIDGIEVLETIHQRWPDTPVVVMSAFANNDVTRQATAACALEILAKPVDIDHIIELVQRVAEPNAPVLILEDDDALRSNLCEALLGIGSVLPYPAATVAKAERLAAAIDFRVVIVDARLPDGDGLAFGQALRGRLGDDLALVYITGYAGEFDDQLRELANREKIHLFEKPFSPGALLTLVKSAV